MHFMIKQNPSPVSPAWEILSKMVIDTGAPVISSYEIFHLIRKLFNEKSYKNMRLSPKNSSSDKRIKDLFREIQTIRAKYIDPKISEYLINVRTTIIPDDELGSSTFRIADNKDDTAEEVTAIADPFCYISHLSAMQRYGLTNRLPTALVLTTPVRPLWRDAAYEKMLTECDGQIPPLPLQKPTFKPKVRGRLVEVHETKYPDIPVPLRGSRARIAPISAVFRDMLTRPELCGGMPHVVDVWLENAIDYLDDIILAITTTSSLIAKVRAGYLLEERLGIKDPRIEAWAVAAQRGSSRKLDPSQPYAPTFSEKWMISINV